MPDVPSSDGIGLCPTFGSGRRPVSVRDPQPKQCSYEHHLICSEYGSVQDVREDMLDEMERQIEEKYGFTVADHGCSFWLL
ncbi:transcriptional repressor [Faecalispora jeddahensis]|uniref:transcriptional repressor n=1 Tax=Faecalispora jeddahensis TaxID=1414721 RepID=UPI003899137D